MSTNIVGILASFAFIFAVIGVSTLLSNKGYLSSEGSRKFIHIAVANWWILAMIFFDSSLYASLVPAAFVVINYLSYKYQVFGAMERDGGAKDLGTVYYAISLLALAWITFSSGNYPYIGAIGILIMGYGDGLAAVIGTRFGKRRFSIGKNQKSVEGTTAMFVSSFVVSLVILTLYNPTVALLYSLVLATFATLLELFSPLGLDNLTVPLLTALLYWILTS